MSAIDWPAAITPSAWDWGVRKAVGRISGATEVDHRVPLKQGGTDDRQNLQGLCHDCHAAKTKAEQGR